MSLVLNVSLSKVCFFFNFIFKLYKIVLVLPNIKMNPPQVYMCSPTHLEIRIGNCCVNYMKGSDVLSCYLGSIILGFGLVSLFKTGL